MIVYPGSGNADGVTGDQILIGPPLVISPAEVEILTARLIDAVEAVTADLERLGALPVDGGG